MATYYATKSKLDYCNGVLETVGQENAVRVPLVGIISCLGKRRMMIGNPMSDGKLHNAIDMVYQVLNAMTGQGLTTIALPRACDEAQPYLDDQFLNVLRFDIANMSHWLWDEKHKNHKMHARQYLRGLINKWGEYHWIVPMPMDDYEVKDPIQEILDMGVSPEKIIGIDSETNETYTIKTENDEISPYGDIS